MNNLRNNIFKGVFNNKYTQNYLESVDNLIKDPGKLRDFSAQLGQPNTSKDKAKQLLTDNNYGKWHNALIEKTQLVPRKSVSPTTKTDWLGDYPNWKSNGGNLSKVKLSEVLEARKINPTAFKNFEVTNKLPIQYMDSLGGSTNYAEFIKQSKEFKNK